ncbi:FAD/NAD(P)-binding domain-containing protein [Ramicandelaber brevisporus]|nr:FAD/NAD(P)-binding domain-containing protein [Ramicandelaber brevisporus]
MEKVTRYWPEVTMATDNGKTMYTARYAQLPTRFPHVALVEQDAIESVLAARLEMEGGVRVERWAELVDFEADEHGVVATLCAHEEQPFTVRARYIVGCDGTHSFVRKRMGWSFAGELVNSEYVLGDCDLVTTTIPDGPVNISSYDGSVTFTPLPNQPIATAGAHRCRIGYRRGHLSSQRPAVTDAEFVADVRRMAGSAYPDIGISNITWLTSYKVNERLSDHYFDEHSGRVLIAGDAAHCHSPAGSQGMNMGLSDAHNLAWKLALAVLRNNHGCAMTLLRSYESERRPVAARVIKHSGRMLRTTQGGGVINGLFREFIMPLLSSKTVQGMTMRTSQIDTRYAHSELVDSCGADESILKHLGEFAQPGMRFPDAQLIDTATGDDVALHYVLARDALFHIVALVPNSPASPDMSGLHSLVARINGMQPSLAGQLRTLVSVTTVAAFSLSGITAAQFRDNIDHGFCKAVSSPHNHTAAKWPVDEFGYDVLLFVVRPDGFIGMVTSLATPGVLVRLARYFVQF